MITKELVVGLGEIGMPILKLLSRNNIVVGYDSNQKLINQKKFDSYFSTQTNFIHICIPYTKNFINNVVSLNRKFSPKGIVIHSTLEPNTTHSLQKKLKQIPVIYSATRGVHKRMLSDLKKYTKFFAVEKTAPNKKWAVSHFKKIMRRSGVKTKQMSSPITLELAKIVCDTSYYGWLIAYAQLSNTIASKHNVDYDEMWQFADEIHKYLGNRPKMLPGFIGGHCVIPNLELIDNSTLNLIKEFNDEYKKILK